MFFLPFLYSITVYWTLPVEVNDVILCSLMYKTGDHNELMIAPVSLEQHWYQIRNLQRNTLYEIRRFCVYGDTRSLSTEWIAASTRTGL